MIGLSRSSMQYRAVPRNDEVLQRVDDRQSATMHLARDADQHLKAMLGNVDGGQKGPNGRMGGGQSRPPQRCSLHKTTFET